MHPLQGPEVSADAVVGVMSSQDLVEIGHLTIGRELRRNSLPRGEYKPASADRMGYSDCQ